MKGTVERVLRCIAAIDEYSLSAIPPVTVSAALAFMSKAGAAVVGVAWKTFEVSFAIRTLAKTSAHGLKLNGK